jgi:hypothetical protein
MNTYGAIWQGGAVIVSALVNWEGVKWLESATYYGYTVKEAKASFLESCERLKYEVLIG